MSRNENNGRVPAVSRTKRLLALVAAGAVLALPACGGGSDAAPAGPIEGGDDVAKLYEAAKEEGSVSLYSHVTASEEIEAFVAAFEEQYPGVDVELTNKTGSAILETFLSEKRAGRNDADVIQYPGMAPFMNEFQDEGFIEEYTPTSADLYPEDAVVPGFAYPWLSYTMGAVYNTDLITPEELELLQTYQGWTDPTWKGRISSGSPGSASIQRSLFQWVAADEELGEDWLRQFAENDPVAFNSVTPAAERVIAGEFVASFPQMSVTAARAIPQGAPVGWVSQDYSVTNPALVAVASNAPHPNAARLMLEFHLSEAGQRAMVEAVKADTLREDLDIPPVQDENFERPSELVVVDEKAFAEGGEDVINLWNQLVGPGAD
jgi:iron(III) transport system substrate-binding protein